jgi:ATP-dependent helicase/nuclease subunit B
MKGPRRRWVTMTERTLFVGPTHSALEEAAFAWADSRTGDGVGRVLYVSDGGDRHDRVAERWRGAYDALALRTVTLTGLVYESYEQVAGPAAMLPGETDRRALEFALDEVVTGRPSLSTGTHASAALVDAFDRRFGRFANLGLDTPEGVREAFRDSALPPRIRDTTVETYEAYHGRRAAVSEPWHVTYAEAFEAVSEADFGTLDPHVECVVLSGFLDPGEAERRVLRSLAEAFPTAAILPTFSESGTDGVDVATETARSTYRDLGFEAERVPGPGATAPLQRVAAALYRDRPAERRTVPETLSWRELPTPEREVRFVARDVRERLAETDASADVGVVVPGLDSYDDYVEDAFDVFGLTYAVESGGALASTNVGGAVERLVALADETPRASDLVELATNPVVDVFDADGEDTLVAAERRTDSDRVEDVRHTLPATMEAAVGGLLDRLAPLRGTAFDAAVEVVRGELDRLGVADAVADGDRGADAAREHAALDQVRELLSSVERTAGPATELSAAAALARAINGASVRGRPDSGRQVTVLSHLDATAFAFDHLYVVGLTTEHFPSVPRHPSFFERMVDAHPALAVVDERHRDRYVFATLVANAESVTLTTPSTAGDATAVVRSPVLDELHRVTGIEPTTGVDERVGSREDLQRAISPLANRREALDAAGERGAFTAGQTGRADRGVQCATERADPDLSPHDGVLDPGTVAEVYPAAEREPYSASRVERYANCGFLFYAEQVLGLADDDDVERTPDPLETGSLVHDTFERFYAELQSDPGDPVDLRAHDPADLEAHMLAVALAELDDADFDYGGLFHRRWLEQLFAGLCTPAENPHYGTGRPHGGVERGLFGRFLDREYRRDGETLPAWFEAPFGTGLPGGEDADPFEIPLPGGGTVGFRGYIDRVDVGGDGGGSRLRLLDYKTGYAPSMTETTGGTKFQLPIYLLAAEAVLADEVGEVTDLSATYYQTRPPNRIREPWGIESKFDTDEAFRRFLDDVVPARLGALTTAIAAGRFHTTVLPASEAGCEHCDYRRACDVRHHQRRDRVELLDDDPETYVPVRATPREFDPTFGGDADD